MTDARATLRELRRTRTKRRLGSTDWYDIAYRVYLFAFAGLVLIVVLSDAIDGLIDDDVDVNVLLTKGPSILGIAVMLAVAMGLRSGADGGPISVEPADIRHVLLAPMSRRAVLFTPIWQRLRSTMFGFGLVGAVVGQLVATELVGSRAAWAASCAIYGAIIGASFVGAGVLAHAVRLPRWTASAVGTALVAWQAAVAWGIWNDTTEGLARIAPANLAGSVALWGIDQRPIDWLAIVAAIIVIGVSLACGGRLRLEPLSRRGELVSQLRFAATSQDLRTVVLLRRQLRAEAPRNRAWFGSRIGSASTADRRPSPATDGAPIAPVRSTASRLDGDGAQAIDRVAPRPALVRSPPGLAHRAHPHPGDRRRSVRFADRHRIAAVRPPAAGGDLRARARVDRGAVAGGRPGRPHRWSADRSRMDLRQSSGRPCDPARRHRCRQRHDRIDPRPEARRGRVRRRRSGVCGAEHSALSWPP